MAKVTLSGEITIDDGTNTTSATLREVSVDVPGITVGGDGQPPEPPGEIEPPPDGGGGTPGEPPHNPNAPPMPPMPSIDPGASGRVLKVGPGQQYQSVQAAMDAAVDGDTVQIMPDCPRQVFGITKILKINGVGVRWDFRDVPTSELYHDKAAILGMSPAWHVVGMEISGCGLDTPAGLTCAIRCSADGYGVIEGCNLHHNQNGVGADATYRWALEVRDTVLDNNGLGDGQTHNLYVNNGVLLVLDGVTSTNPVFGHAIKSRAYTMIATDCTLEAQNGSCFNLPSGGAFAISNCTLRKTAQSPDHHVMGYAEENSNAGLLDGNSISGGVVDAQCNNPFVTSAGGSMTFSGVEWRGNKVTAQGAGASGIHGLP